MYPIDISIELQSLDWRLKGELFGPRFGGSEGVLVYLLLFLPLDDAIASRAVTVVERAETLMKPAK